MDLKPVGERRPVVLSISGGMDSGTLIAWALNYDFPIAAILHFQYGSKHNPYERSAVCALIDHYGLHSKFREVDLTQAFAGIRSNLLFNGGSIPEGHYAAETMKQTVVPGRNLMFASVLAAVAESEGAGHIVLGVHSGDHAIYPDCRPAFVMALDRTVQASTDGAVTVKAPFLNKDKHGILRLGVPLEVPYHLTRTCYKDQEVACGKCGSCQERLEAWRLLGQADPIDYEFRDALPQ